MADGVFGDELEEGGGSEVVAAFEGDVPASKTGVLGEVKAQGFGVAGVEKVYGAAKCGVGDALVVGELGTGKAVGLEDLVAKARPAEEAALAGDGEVGVGELDGSGKDLGVRLAGEAGVELAEALCGSEILRGVELEEIFGLVLEVREVGVGREGLDGHARTSFQSARVRVVWAESKFELCMV